MSDHQTAAGRIAELKADLERARTWAVALEQQVARVSSLADEWEREDDPCAPHFVADIRHALEVGDA